MGKPRPRGLKKSTKVHYAPHRLPLKKRIIFKKEAHKHKFVASKRRFIKNLTIAGIGISALGGTAILTAKHSKKKKLELQRITIELRKAKLPPAMLNACYKFELNTEHAKTLRKITKNVFERLTAENFERVASTLNVSHEKNASDARIARRASLEKAKWENKLLYVKTRGTKKDIKKIQRILSIWNFVSETKEGIQLVKHIWRTRSKR